MFVRALIVSQILTFQILDLENVGKYRRVQHSQWHHSVTNINLYESRSMHFYASIHRFRDVKVWNVWPGKRMSRSRSTTFAMAPVDGKTTTSYFTATVMFRTIYEIFAKQIKMPEVWCRNWRSLLKKRKADPRHLTGIDWLYICEFFS